MFKTVFAQNTRDLISQFVKTEFKLKYNNSVLGFIWVLIKPLVLFLILFLVMSQVFPNGTIKYFPLYLLLGTILAGHFSEATSAGISALLYKQALILKVNFPRYIVIISALLLPAINFLINLGIFFIIAIAFFGIIPSFLEIIWFLFAYLMLFVLMLGFSLFTSIWLVRLRDLSSIWELMLQLLFWLTPVFYDLNVIKDKKAVAHWFGLNINISSIMGSAIGEFNPLSVTLQITRDALIYNKISHIGLLLVWWVFAILFCVAGYFYFRTNVKRIAEDF